MFKKVSKSNYEFKLFDSIESSSFCEENSFKSYQKINNIRKMSIEVINKKFSFKKIIILFVYLILNLHQFVIFQFIFKQNENIFKFKTKKYLFFLIVTIILLFLKYLLIIIIMFVFAQIISIFNNNNEIFIKKKENDFNVKINNFFQNISIKNYKTYFNKYNFKYNFFSLINNVIVFYSTFYLPYGFIYLLLNNNILITKFNNKNKIYFILFLFGILIISIKIKNFLFLIILLILINIISKNLFINNKKNYYIKNNLFDNIFSTYLNYFFILFQFIIFLIIYFNNKEIFFEFLNTKLFFYLLIFFGFLGFFQIILTLFTFNFYKEIKYFEIMLSDLIGYFIYQQYNNPFNIYYNIGIVQCLIILYLSDDLK